MTFQKKIAQIEIQKLRLKNTTHEKKTAGLEKKIAGLEMTMKRR